MVYTPEEKARMDVLLHAFQHYVDAHTYYDILYSHKAGFLRVCVGESADQIYFPISGFDDMLRMFVADFLQDEENRMENFLLLDYDHVRTLLTPILEKLGDDRTYVLAFMEEEFENCRHRREQTRQKRLIMIRETEDLLEELRKSVMI